MNITEYRAHPALSYSKLKSYLKSALHGLTQEQFVESAAMRFGSAVDLALKGQLDDVIVNPHEDGRTKAAKEFKQLNEGKLVLTQSEMDRVLSCVSAVKVHPAVQSLNLHMLESDKPLFGMYQGFQIKGLPDWSFGGTVIDLKTTSGLVDSQNFARTVDNFHYDLQAAVYCELAKQAGDCNPSFFWIVVESDRPHDVAVYKATERILEVGYAKLNHALHNYRKAAIGEFLGTQQFVAALEMPAWYGRSFELSQS
jgi:hypothetical protein